MFNYGILYEKDTENTEDKDNYSSATINFVIPYTVISSKKIEGFKLFSVDDSLTEYAEVDCDIDLENNKSNLRVSWTLKISPK